VGGCLRLGTCLLGNGKRIGVAAPFFVCCWCPCHVCVCVCVYVCACRSAPCPSPPLPPPTTRPLSALLALFSQFFFSVLSSLLYTVPPAHPPTPYPSSFSCTSITTVFCLFVCVSCPSRFVIQLSAPSLSLAPQRENGGEKHARGVCLRVYAWVCLCVATTNTDNDTALSLWLCMWFLISRVVFQPRMVRYAYGLSWSVSAYIHLYVCLCTF
jgi:hypothetical protein